MLQLTDNVKNLLKASGSLNKTESINATAELAKALELPLRKGILDGDILGGIFEAIELGDGVSPEFPLDLLSPGTEKDWVAFTIPNHGYIPQRNVESDYVMIPMYEIGGAVDWLLKYARDARWDVVGRCMEVLRAQFTKKMNDDGWHTILAAGVDRNIVVLDSDAAAGQFTKRLVSLGKTVMRRNGGGNTTSMSRGKLTDMYISPEAMEDIRNWNVDQIDEVTRREIFVADGDNAINRIFGVNLHDLDELGEGQEYQLYATSDLSVTLPGSDVELAVGLDLSNRDCFVMPTRDPGLQIFPDDSMLRQRRMGLWGTLEIGFAALDSRRTLLLSM